ncbi:hypothetical protein B0H21DRAFT_828938 [Amylocystis lapponica]|nr:hypothetical protein B0H21DRAFT_828938 [Amylocystis lapponica]
MATSAPPRPLRSFLEVHGAIRPPQDADVIKATDCLALAQLDSPPYPANMWISSPNMHHLPEPPAASSTKPLSYYGDGMLGAYELFKWPQAYDQVEPHGMAAPANSKVMRRLADSSPTDTHGVLPKFADSEAPWLGCSPEDFIVAHDVRSSAGSMTIGNLSRALVDRLLAAAQDTVRTVEPVWQAKYGARANDTKEQAHYRTGRRRGILERMSTMCRAISKLEEVPMSFFDAIMWFREAQRLLLEVRGWLIYEAVIAPRLRDPEVDHTLLVLPLRGVVTTRLTLVEELYRIGVPVWWVRPIHTLTSSTVIYKVMPTTPWRQVMSDKPTMSDGRSTRNAPAWGHSDTIRPLGESLAYQMRRFSLSGKPVIAELLPVWEEDGQLVAADHVGSSNAGATRGPATSRSGPSQASSASAERPSGSAARPSASRSARAKQKRQGKGDVHRKDEPAPLVSIASVIPDWVQQPCQGWAAALEKLKDLPTHQQHHSGRQFLFALPPPHAFYGRDETRARLIHNWIRIRTWCFAQALDPPPDARVLLTTTQWHMTLEGDYYRVPPERLVIHPKSTDTEIARLPREPSSAKRARMVDPPVERRKLRRLADRVDIAVRMVLRANIAPYDGPYQLAYFGTAMVTDQVASTDRDLWSEVVWELVLFNFRLEVMLLDRKLLPDEYTDTTMAQMREQALRGVWSDKQSLRPSLRNDLRGDQLSNAEWRERRPAFEQWASMMQAWPGGTALESAALELDNKKKYLNFEVTVVEFYCRIFHATFARLPTVPQRAPWSLLRHA